MSIAFGITLFAITGGIMVGYTIYSAMVVDQFEKVVAKNTKGQG